MNSRIYTISRLTVAAVWFYHGLVPKLIVKHADEFKPLLAAGFSPETAGRMVQTAGIAEILLAVALLVFWRWRGGYWLTIGLMPIALIGVAISAPQMLGMAFNPFSLNLCMIALSAIGLIVDKAN